MHRLLYRAPVDANDLTEIVRYENYGSPRQVLVRVANTADARIQSLALTKSFKILVQLFVLAVLLEQALSVIFNWRAFLQNFDARGAKTIVAVAVARFVVGAFQLDLVKDIVHVYAVKPPSSGVATTLLTALILAGGSSGVNNVLVSLGWISITSIALLSKRAVAAPQVDKLSDSSDAAHLAWSQMKGTPITATGSRQG